MSKKVVIAMVVVIVLGIIVIGAFTFASFETNKSKPEEIFETYVAYLINGQYEEMYELLDENSKKNTSQDVFVSRNKNIYNGIEAKDIKISNVEAEEFENRKGKY